MNARVVIAQGAATPGSYGRLVLNADGSFTDTLDNHAADPLGQGQHASDVFHYTVVDSLGVTATTTLTIDIIATNDAPAIIGGTDSGTVVEDGLDAAQQHRGTPIASGTLTRSDVDSDDNASNDSWRVVAGQGQTQSGSATVTGTYGSLTVDQDRHWTYTLDNSLTATQALALDQTATKTFTVEVADSHGATADHQVTVMLTGSNEAPAIADGHDSGTVIEDGLDAAQQYRGTPIASGALTKSDVDSDDTAANDSWRAVAGQGQAQSGSATVIGTYGSLC